jgi:hypothetical protein
MSTALTVLRGLLGLLGASACAIAVSIVLFGPGPTAAAFESGYAALTGWKGPSSPAWPADMDSEMRFYAPLFGAFGVLALGVAQRPRRRLSLAPWLAGVFFLGGVGRALSWLTVGAPHPLFLALMTIELGLPPVLVALWWAERGAKV